jgi:hypothetical protein
MVRLSFDPAILAVNNYGDGFYYNLDDKAKKHGIAVCGA